MRHATDPDHVIAVTTIVSRERKLGSAALVGVLWGLGHTVTIVLAGLAIVVFGTVVSPRVGLTMELSVALMLVLLGAMSVLGALRSPPHAHGDYVHAHPHPAGGTVTAKATTTRRWPALIFASAGSACTRSSARSWWAWSTGWPAQPPSPSSFSRPFVSRFPLSATSWFSGWGPSRA
jgi:ABC-type nickel/cobalt efflux system permease component RcnA